QVGRCQVARIQERYGPMREQLVGVMGDQHPATKTCLCLPPRAPLVRTGAGGSIASGGECSTAL
ncbi:MAG: hypothetical protein OSB10_09535, partial [Planctomycetota bacterium]|nr:hypothetical protein [Planctomycetota bacterium]